MAANGHFYAPAASYPGEMSCFVKAQAAWDFPEPVWRLWKEEKSVPRPGFEAQFFHFPALNLVSVPKEIFQFQTFKVTNQQVL
jgi:hypothetical protein